MTVAVAPTPRREQRGSIGSSKIARRVAAVAGAAGAAVVGDASAEGITYVPTAGVIAAQGIPGFSFAAPTTVTSGTLRPPSSEGVTGWDIDGNTVIDFDLQNGGGFFSYEARLVPLAVNSSNPNGLIAAAAAGFNNLRNMANAAAVNGAAGIWNNGFQIMTEDGSNYQASFALDQPGFFGFRFTTSPSSNDYYYGWGSLTIEGAPNFGYGYKVTQAFYQSTPNTGINVGAVPVPEPSSMALLAAGAAGVTAWRARKKKQPAAE